MRNNAPLPPLHANLLGWKYRAPQAGEDKQSREDSAEPSLPLRALWLAPEPPWPLSWYLIPSSGLWSGGQLFLRQGVSGMNGLSLLCVLSRVVTVHWSLQGTCRV